MHADAIPDFAERTEAARLHEVYSKADDALYDAEKAERPEAELDALMAQRRC